MRAALALAVVLSFALAGCADDAAPANDQPVAPAAPDPWNQVTAFHWASDFDGSDTALEIVFELGAGGDCDLESTQATTTTRLGPNGLIVLEEDGVMTGWASGGQFETATVHAGPVDSRDGAGGGGGDSRSGFGGGFAGKLVVTLLMPGARSASLDLACDNPFDVVGASIGHSLAMADEGSTEGGTGATVSLVGSASVGDSLSMSITAPRARAAFSAVGEQAGTVELVHPGGTESWDLAGGWADAIVEGGPGDYTFTVERVAANFDLLWLAVYGLESDFPLAPGLIVDGSDPAEDLDPA